MSLLALLLLLCAIALCVHFAPAWHLCDDNNNDKAAAPRLLALLGCSPERRGVHTEWLYAPLAGAKGHVSALLIGALASLLVALVWLADCSGVAEQSNRALLLSALSYTVLVLIYALQVREMRGPMVCSLSPQYRHLFSIDLRSSSLWVVCVGGGRQGERNEEVGYVCAWEGGGCICGCSNVTCRDAPGTIYDLGSSGVVQSRRADGGSSTSPHLALRRTCVPPY